MLVSDHRGRTLRRIDPSGSVVWSCDLPGYVRVHPSAYGSFLVVQTRQGSYGGQATTGIDLNNGKLLWSETVNAYGCGVAFADDACYCVEGDAWLSPDAIKGRLICRKPSTGAVLWTYSVPQATLSHAPVLDRATGRVYAAFNEGTVVSVNGKTGEALWKIKLPEQPLAAPAASYDPYRSSVSLHDGLLCVTSSLATLFVLDTKTGEIRGRVALTKDIVRQGNIAGREKLAAAPLVVGDLLIVPTEGGITAYRHDFERKREGGDGSE